jgi:signal transduction histidine kinase
MPPPITRRRVGDVSVDEATGPTLARLRAARASQLRLVRWLNRLAPLLLTVYVVAGFRADQRPGLSGAGLVVSIVLFAFPVAVLGRNATEATPNPTHLTFVTGIGVSSLTLMWFQPNGPGSAGVLLAALCIARLVPVRFAVPGLVAVFLILEVTPAVTGADFGNLSTLAAIGAFYGMMYLAFRLGEANQQAERLLVELRESQAAQARAAGMAERQRLAREMHDVLAHSLSGLMLQLEGARMMAAEDPADPRLPGTIDRAHRLGKSGLEEARRAIGMLRDDELPGPDRLAGLAARFEQDRDVPCRLTVSGTAHELAPEARLALYRVAQEALTNITKHAAPDRVEVQLTYGPEAIRLTVEDFAAAGAVRAAETGGYGLTGMRERAELLGGTLVTEATPSGFRVALDVPA